MNPETFPQSITGKFPGKSPEKKKQTTAKKNSNINLRFHATRELQNLVLAWMKDSTGPRRNRSVFARKAEVANSTVQRLMNDDVFPSTDNLIKMLHVLFASDDLAAIKTKLEQHHTNLYTYIKNIPVFAKIPKKSSYGASTPESAEDKQLKIDVIRELREMISEFMRNNPDYSTIPTFARKANVNEPIVRKIFTSSRAVPGHDNLMRILTALTALPNTREVIQHFKLSNSPIHMYVIKHTIFSSASANQGTGFAMEGVSIPAFPNDDDFLLAYSLLESLSTPKTSDLQLLMGESAKVAVNRLLKLGLVILESDGLLRLTKGPSIVTKETALNIARVLINRFTRSDAEDSRVTLYFESVSDDGFRDLNRITDEYIRAVTEVLDNKKGNVPFFLFGVLDKMQIKNRPELFEAESASDDELEKYIDIQYIY